MNNVVSRVTSGPDLRLWGHCGQELGPLPPWA